MESLHLKKDNKEVFEKIVTDDGIAIHGFGAFGKAIYALLAQKINDLKISGKITVFVRSDLSNVLIDTLIQAHKISDKEKTSPEKILKSFLSKECLEDVCQRRQLLTGQIGFSPNLNIISEQENYEDFEKAVRDNKYHFLAIPSSQIESKMDEIKNITAEDLVFIDLAKGEHTIKTEYQDQTIHVSGPNFASEIVAGKPSGADVGGTNQELITAVMKILYSKNFRPYEQKDVKAVLEGGIWKNVLALTAGFLTEDSNLKEKSKIIAGLFIKMLEWGEKNGIARKDLLGLAGIGDFYLCMNPKSRNFAAGREINNLLGKSSSFDDLRQEVKQSIAKSRGDNEITIESLETLKKYFENPEFKSDILIKSFYDLSNKKLTENELVQLKAEMKNSLRVNNSANIKEEDLKFIKLIARGVKMLTTKFNLRGNTEAMLLARSLPEVFDSLKINLDDLDNNDLYVVLETVFEVAFSDINIREEQLTKILGDFPEDKISKINRPILKTILAAVKNDFDEKTIQKLILNLMSRPIKMSV